MKRNTTLIIVTIILIALSIWVDWPGSRIVPLLNREISTHLGLDLVGGVRVLLEADVPATQEVDSDSMDTVRTIIENRVNAMGVGEILVIRAGDRRMVVEIPGAEDPEKAIDTIQQTALLEFVDMGDATYDELIYWDEIQATILTDYNQSIDQSTSVTSTTGTTSTVGSPTRIWHTIMTGKELTNAGVILNQMNEYNVSFELTSEGSAIFSEYTSNNVGRVLAILLDKKLISYPRINTAITQGGGIIEGQFTRDDAEELAVQLKYGALPIPLKVVESNTVGPTLGQDSLNKSLTAGGIGLGLVIIFMALYYRLPGVIADVALLIYALLTFALFRLIPVTLTLPGIAGFVLSIGMAVDANVLIFERLKEELREGNQLRPAIEKAWSRAFTSIRDSNLATLITCTIIYVFGSAFGASIVKGFSLTLAIGVLVSLFTAIVVTRTILHLVLDNLKFTEHPRWFGI